MKSLKWYRRLQSGRIRRQEGFFLIEGLRAVEQIVTAGPHAVEEILLVETLDPPQFVVPYQMRTITQEQYRSISASVTPQGIAALLRIPSDTYSAVLPASAGSRIVLLDDVQDPGNVGTIIRTAAAFGFHGILMTGGCADPFSPKAVQASAGALFAPWIRRSDCILDCVDTLKADGYPLACAVLDGTPLVDFVSGEKIIVALGNEGGGIGCPVMERADIRYTIPMVEGAVESLNVAVAGAVIFFTVFNGSRW